MPRVEFLEERCKGCLLCATVCPVEILAQSDKFNSKGYKIAQVVDGGMDKCTGCSACAMICPDLAIRVYKAAKTA